MAYLNEKCKLCLNIIDGENFTLIEEVVDILAAVLSKPNFANGHKHYICSVCSNRLNAAFQFKSTCLCTNDTILPYIVHKNPSPVDLKEIYIKEKKFNVSDDEKICRLCMQPIKGQFVSVQEVGIDIFQTLIPEVNLSAVKNPVICKTCLDALVTHTSFIRNCLDVGNKINMDLEETDTDNKKDLTGLDLCIKCEGNEWEEDKKSISAAVKTESNFEELEVCGNEKKLIKSEEIEIKYNDIVEKEYIEQLSGSSQVLTENEPSVENSLTAEYFLNTENSYSDSEHKSQFDFNIIKYDVCNIESKNLSKHKKHKPVHKNISKIKNYGCDICSYEAKYKHHLDRHMLKHKDPSEIIWYKCELCNFKSKWESCMKRHVLMHTNSSGGHWSQCDMCDFKTLSHASLNRHLLLQHKEDAEIYWHYCKICDHKTKQKHQLKSHMLSHKDPSEIHWYKCEKCEFKSKWKKGLKDHMLIHKSASEIQWFHCDLCGYKSKTKRYMKLHLLKHDNSSGGNWLECDLCGYKTIRKGDFNKHLSRHKSDSEIKWYHCNTCDYKAKWKHQLNSHMLIHKDTSEVEWYNCGVCKFKSKWKTSLENHMLQHKSVSEIQLFECDACDYKSKWKKSMQLHLLKHMNSSEERRDYKTVN